MAVLAVSGDIPRVLHNFAASDSQDAILAALISTVNYQNGNTRLKLALNEAQSNIFTKSNPAFRWKGAAAIVISDGFTGESVSDVAAAANSLRAVGVRVLALGSKIRGDFGSRALHAVVSSSSDLYLASSAEANAGSVALALASAVSCVPAPTTTVGPPVLCLAGSSAVCSCGDGCSTCAISDAASQCVNCSVPNVLLNGACVASCPAGYSTSVRKDGTRLCVFQTDNLDLSFIVDSSGSIDPAVFEGVKAFAAGVVDQLPVSSADARCVCLFIHLCSCPDKFHIGSFGFSSLVANSCSVSFMTYADVQSTTLRFSDSYNKQTIKSRIMSTNYLGGGSDTAEALDTASLQLFGRSSSGARGINGVVVIVTDGIADDALENVQQAAAALKALVRRVIVIGVGADVSTSDLLAMASAPEYVFVGDSTGVGGLTAAQLVAVLGSLGAPSTTPSSNNVEQSTTTTGPVNNNAAVPNGGSSSSDSTIIPVILGERSLLTYSHFSRLKPIPLLSLAFSVNCI